MAVVAGARSIGRVHDFMGEAFPIRSVRMMARRTVHIVQRHPMMYLRESGLVLVAVEAQPRQRPCESPGEFAAVGIVAL